MSRRLLAGSLVAGAAILSVVFTLDVRGPIYVYPLREFLARPVHDQTVRLEGRLVHGSLCRFESPCGFAFSMLDPAGDEADRTEGRSRALAVHHPRCVLPDTVRDIAGWDVTLTVEGTLCTGCHVFEASTVMGKCPSKYELNPNADALLRAARPIPLCVSGARARATP